MGAACLVFSVVFWWGPLRIGFLPPVMHTRALPSCKSSSSPTSSHWMLFLLRYNADLISRCFNSSQSGRDLEKKRESTKLVSWSSLTPVAGNQPPSLTPVSCCCLYPRPNQLPACWKITLCKSRFLDGLFQTSLCQGQSASYVYTCWDQRAEQPLATTTPLFRAVLMPDLP